MSIGGRLIAALAVAGLVSACSAAEPGTEDIRQALTANPGFVTLLGAGLRVESGFTNASPGDDADVLRSLTIEKQDCSPAKDQGGFVCHLRISRPCPVIKDDGDEPDDGTLPEEEASDLPPGSSCEPGTVLYGAPVAVRLYRADGRWQLEERSSPAVREGRSSSSRPADNGNCFFA